MLTLALTESEVAGVPSKYAYAADYNCWCHVCVGAIRRALAILVQLTLNRRMETD